MQETTLKDALRVAQTSIFEEAGTHIQLVRSQLAQLEHLDQLTDGGTLLFEKAKLVRRKTLLKTNVSILSIVIPYRLYQMLKICFYVIEMN